MAGVKGKRDGRASMIVLRRDFVSMLRVLERDNPEYMRLNG